LPIFIQVIKCLLIEPNAESALNEEAGKLLLEDYEAYAKHARLLTSIHAKPVESVLVNIGNNLPDKKKTLRRL
jgi:ubiquitin-conjugating enzyme E2 S